MMLLTTDSGDHSARRCAGNGPSLALCQAAQLTACAVACSRIAEVVAPNKDACFLHKAQQLDQAGKVGRQERDI